jgi:hypothetical protein
MTDDVDSADSNTTNEIPDAYYIIYITGEGRCQLPTHFLNMSMNKTYYAPIVIVVIVFTPTNLNQRFIGGGTTKTIYDQA